MAFPASTGSGNSRETFVFFWITRIVLSVHEMSVILSSDISETRIPVLMARRNMKYGKVPPSFVSRAVYLGEYVSQLIIRKAWRGFLPASASRTQETVCIQVSNSSGSQETYEVPQRPQQSWHAAFMVWGFPADKIQNISGSYGRCFFHSGLF